MAEMDKEIVPWRDKYRENEEPKTHHAPSFEDSFAIRGLCVAYDLTGQRKYLDACTRWADRMVDRQRRMTPKGAYYLNYGKFRQPGEDKGWWFAADASTVAEAVLAVAVRSEGERREKYLDSVRSFARLVIDNYVGKGEGITDGIWSFQGEWWSSTATFGTFLFHAYAVTKDPEYLKVALGCVDWMNGHDFHKPDPPAFAGLSIASVYYCGEFYAAALPYLEAGGPRRKMAESHVAEMLQWLAENQKGRGAKTDWGYLQMGKTYMSGMPYVMYLLAKQLPERRDLTSEADREMRYVTGLLFPDDKKPRLSIFHVWESSTWAMLSYAERLCPGAMFRSPATPIAPSALDGYGTRFLQMCDQSIVEMAKPIVPYFERYRKHEDPKTHHYPFFMDSYAVRPLCVAYDMTGAKKYLNACTRWADMVVGYQKQMTPKDAFFLNYGKFRQPGEDKGWWFVADSGSIGAAMLAVAVRCEGQRREKYLDSVRSFTRLVIDNYRRKSGGITDGIWNFDGEWWSSTATFGTLLFQAYAVTKNPEYLKVALGCVDWMNGHDFHKPELPAFAGLSAASVYYCGEFYAAALPYLEAGSQRRKTAESHVAEMLQWLAESQKGRGAKTDWNYRDKGKVHISGCPYFMYNLARDSDRYRDLAPEADRELRYIDELLFRDGKPRETNLEVWGLMTYGMMSYAERLSPGGLNRTSRQRP